MWSRPQIARALFDEGFCSNPVDLNHSQILQVNLEYFIPWQHQGCRLSGEALKLSVSFIACLKEFLFRDLSDNGLGLSWSLREPLF
jgi:hypothetical protein